MADLTSEPGAGGVAARAGALTRLTGAAVSVGLIAGMGVWGYKLIVRDATGIPVVRAMEGPMREAPSNPGGTLAVNTGLAVNEVVAVGEASAPEDRLLLAPQAPELTEEDLIAMPTAEQDEVLPEGVMAGAVDIDADLASADASADGEAAVADAPMSAEEILALADQISAGAEPMGALADAPVADDGVAAARAAVSGAVAEQAGQSAEDAVDAIVADVAAEQGERIAANVPGVAQAVRPPARPSGLSAVTQLSSASAETPAAPVSVTTGEFAVGTTLVQLGAFDTADLAGEAWGDLARRFAEFMDGKERVVQAATSGGREFYRLRAMGFTDIAEARRFCSALIAEEADCIPVVVQ